MVKTFIEKRNELVRAYPAFQAFDPKHAAKPENVGIALHPGAAKYYKEKNIDVKTM